MACATRPPSRPRSRPNGWRPAREELRRTEGDSRAVGFGRHAELERQPAGQVRSGPATVGSRRAARASRPSGGRACRARGAAGPPARPGGTPLSGRPSWRRGNRSVVPYASTASGRSIGCDPIRSELSLAISTSSAEKASTGVVSGRTRRSSTERFQKSCSVAKPRLPSGVWRSDVVDAGGVDPGRVAREDDSAHLRRVAVVGDDDDRRREAGDGRQGENDVRAGVQADHDDEGDE